MEPKSFKIGVETELGTHMKKTSPNSCPQVPKMTPNGSQNRPQIDPKATPERPKIEPKTGSDAKCRLGAVLGRFWAGFGTVLGRSWDGFGEGFGMLVIHQTARPYPPTRRHRAAPRSSSGSSWRGSGAAGAPTEGGGLYQSPQGDTSGRGEASSGLSSAPRCQYMRPSNYTYISLCVFCVWMRGCVIMMRAARDVWCKACRILEVGSPTRLIRGVCRTFVRIL